MDDAQRQQALEQQQLAPQPVEQPVLTPEQRLVNVEAEVRSMGGRLDAFARAGQLLEESNERLLTELRELREALNGRAQRPRGGQQFKLPAPKTFEAADGTRTVKSWLSQFRAYAEYTGQADSLTEAMMRGYLGGKCLQAYRAHQASCRPEERVVDLDSFERVLVSLVNLGNEQDQARQKLKAITQGVMPIGEYNSAFAQLAVDCPDRSDFDKVGDYIDGLNASIRKDVKLRNCRTLGEAMQAAVAASGIDVTVAPVGGPTGGFSAQVATQAQPMDVDRLMAMMNSMTRGGGRSGKGRRCWNCDKEGHLSRDCPEPKK